MTKASSIAYLGLGGNLGNSLNLFDEAIQHLKEHPNTRDVIESPRFESEPFEATGPNFVNSVVKLFWEGEPLALLKLCLEIEAHYGRVRTYQNAPRTIDLDVLLFGDQIINLEDLTIPHPRMHQRRFVLEPLLALDPDISIPKLGLASNFLPQTLNQWLQVIKT